MSLKERALYTASLALFVVAICAYLYEAPSTGLLPVVTHPFRIHAIPVALKKVDGQKPPLDLAFIRNISEIYWIIVLIGIVIGLVTPVIHIKK